MSPGCDRRLRNVGYPWSMLLKRPRTKFVRVRGLISFGQALSSSLYHEGVSWRGIFSLRSQSRCFFRTFLQWTLNESKTKSWPSKASTLILSSASKLRCGRFGDRLYPISCLLSLIPIYCAETKRASRILDKRHPRRSRPSSAGRNQSGYSNP
jgi:hypothetical protein